MVAPENQKLLTKSTLVTVSHAIERAALAVGEDGPMLVLALFQRMPYFERERDVYERIARRAAVTVVGVVGDQPGRMPDGVHLVALNENEAYAREWTVVVLTPRFGAVLVAYDREQVSGAAATLEAGRLFDGWWSLRRDDALHKALALQAAFADRLPPAARAAVSDVLAYVRDLPAGTGESRADALARLLIEHAERAGTELASLRRRVAVADHSPVTAADEVSRWSGTASGTLPVALLAVRVPSPHQLPEQAGRRTGALRNEGLIAVLSAVLRDSDRLTRLSDDDFLLMLPALSLADALKTAHQLQADLAAAAAHNAFLPGGAHMLVMATRRRPFPIPRIIEGLDWAQRERVPVAQVEDA
ncbi:DICT sensory domain-containing protein [Catenuloplanes atrovinosus]|uniref:DICT domain-containing protein n=1 Tax=Catenuloplanes atrovinosus TaxID=137266 RepID=A0AAE3YK31_9ACTN|nr:DICT sensory domain-containing protein [Catenuloplanes atrovinosus]MDR7275288.1 DICT domain-containing protein [Catenuloplanes atrovinosus]